MLAPRAGAVGYRRHAGQGAEAVAVVDEWFGPGGQHCAPRRRLIAILKRGHQRVGWIESECGTNKHPVAGDGRSCVASEPGETGAEVALDRRGIGARQPTPGAFKPGRLWVLVVDLSRMQLTDEHAGGATDGMRLCGELLVELAQPGDQLGTGCDDAWLVARRMTSWTGGPSRRIVTFQVAEPLPAIGSTSRSGSGSRTASPWSPSRIN